jgi:cellobiose-specific phosphotransferase system component IIC
VASRNLSAYPAEKARGGEIILRRPWQRAVFMGGLAGCIVLLLIALFFPGAGY